MKEVYGPNLKIRLCTVHIQRAWWRNFVKHVGKTNFKNNPGLREAWTILNGTFFLPYERLNVILMYFKNVILPNLQKTSVKRRFGSYLEYLEDNYFSEVALYPHYLWCYFQDINEYSEFNTTTNAAEAVNRKLKDFCKSGYISFHKACKILQKFKSDYIADKESVVGGGNLNPRKKRTLRREDEILSLVREFDHLEGTFTFALDPDLAIINFAFRLGSVGKVDILNFSDTDSDP